MLFVSLVVARFLCFYLVIVIFGFAITSQVIGWKDWFLHQ